MCVSINSKTIYRNNQLLCVIVITDNYLWQHITDKTRTSFNCFPFLLFCSLWCPKNIDSIFMLLFSGGSRVLSWIDPFLSLSLSRHYILKQRQLLSTGEPLLEPCLIPKAIIHAFLLLALIWFTKQLLLHKTCINRNLKSIGKKIKVMFYSLS